MKSIFATFSTVSYFLMGMVQLFALWAFLTDYWHWPSLLAGIAGLFLVGIPIIGSVCGFIGAYVVWGWEWWQAGILFFWWPVLMLCFGAFGVGTDFISKLSPVKRAFLIGILIAGLCGFGWWSVNNKTETDWRTAAISTSSQKKFAIDFVHSFQNAPLPFQGDILLAIYELFYINSREQFGTDPFLDSPSEQEIYTKILEFLYTEARREKDFNLAAIFEIRNSVRSKYPNNAKLYDSTYAPHLGKIIRERVAAMDMQEREAEFLKRLDATKKAAEDLMQ